MMAHNVNSESRIITCPYCGKRAALTTGRVVYRHRPDLYRKQFWACIPCWAWVGCHPGTIEPMGRLADRELRKAKQHTHQSFDPLWKTGHMGRRSAYTWLAYKLGIPIEECHIGMFDIEMCNKAITISVERQQKAIEEARS